MAREVVPLSRDRKHDRRSTNSSSHSDHRHGGRDHLSLENIEQGIGKAIERPFSRLFRSPVQPAEIERACTREVEKSRRLGVSTVYVANVYYVVISPKDEESLGNLIGTLESDLSTRLYAYAANNRYEMVTRPVVTFMVDDDFKLGDLLVYGEHMSEADVAVEFGIETGHGAPKPHPAEHIQVTPQHHAPMPTPPVYAESAPAQAWEPLESAAIESSPPTSPTPWGDEPRSPGGPVPVTTPVPGRLIAGIAVAGRPPLALHRGMRYTIGRQEGCDIVIVDPQVSRVHATIEGDAKGWYIADRGSTNGTLVNRVATTTQKLHNGDIIRIGDVDITYGESWVDDKSSL